MTTEKTSLRRGFFLNRLEKFVVHPIKFLAPLFILGGGWWGYELLSQQPVKVPPPPAPPQPVRTRVQSLKRGEYPVVVKTHGVVQSGNMVVLSAQVGGRIAVVNPAFEAGAYFEEGDVLVEIESQDYQNACQIAKARLEVTKAAYELANANHARNAQLMEQAVVAKEEFDQTAAVLAQSKAEMNSAAAQVDKADRDLTRTKIVAPFDGRVRSRVVGKGQLVAAGTPLGEIFTIDFTEVRLPIAGRDLRFLELPELQSDPSLDVELRDAIDPANPTVWKAKIVRTEGVLDENSLDLFAIARIEDPFGRKSGAPPLRIGQPVVGAITGRVLHDVVAIPRGAVRQLDKVFLIEQPGMLLAAKTIQPVWSDEAHVVVDDASITDGALVSTTHLVFAPDKAKVEIISDPPSEDASTAESNSASLGNSVAQSKP